MADPLEKELDDLLDAFDKRQEQRKEVQNAQTLQEDKFVADFASFRSKTARPLFERVGNHLRQRGHDFDIEEVDYSVDRDGKTTNARISFHLFPMGVNRHEGHSFPSYAITASRGRQVIHLHGSNMLPSGGAFGPRGDFKLDQLTLEIVERDLLKLLTEVFSK